MGRKSLKNELSDYIKKSAYLTLTLEGVALVGNVYLGYESDYLWPMIIGFGYTALSGWLDNRRVPSVANFQITAGRFYGGQVASVNGRDRWFLNSVPFRSTTKTIKYKEPKPEPLGEFFWEVKIPERERLVTIRETRLLRFCQIAFDRQSAGEVHPMSRAYFLNEARWPFASYRACTAILSISNLTDNRRQGASGRLLHPPGMTVRHAKHLYPLLASPL